MPCRTLPLDLLLLPSLVLPVRGIHHLVEVTREWRVHAAVDPRQLVLERLQLQLVESLQSIQALVRLGRQVRRGGREAGPKVPQNLVKMRDVERGEAEANFSLRYS